MGTRWIPSPIVLATILICTNSEDWDEWNGGGGGGGGSGGRERISLPWPSPFPQFASVSHPGWLYCTHPAGFLGSPIQDGGWDFSACSLIHRLLVLWVGNSCCWEWGWVKILNSTRQDLSLSNNSEAKHQVRNKWCILPMYSSPC